MKLLTLLFCIALFVSSISHASYAEDLTIKQKLTDLQALIDKEPPFSFRGGMAGKLFFNGKLKEAILSVEDNKPEIAKVMLQRLFIEIQGRSAIINPMRREDVRRRLSDILTDMTKE